MGTLESVEWSDPRSAPTEELANACCVAGMLSGRRTAGHRGGAVMSGSQRTHNFADRHIGPDASDASEMLRVIGRDSLSALIPDTVPESILRPGKSNNETIQAVDKPRMVATTVTPTSSPNVSRAVIGKVTSNVYPKTEGVPVIAIKTRERSGAATSSPANHTPAFNPRICPENRPLPPDSGVSTFKRDERDVTGRSRSRQRFRWLSFCSWRSLTEIMDPP